MKTESCLSGHHSAEWRLYSTVYGCRKLTELWGEKSQNHNCTKLISKHKMVSFHNGVNHCNMSTSFSHAGLTENTFLLLEI